MGDNYTPEISNFMYGEIIHVHPITNLFTIKILRTLNHYFFFYILTHTLNSKFRKY